MNSFWHNRAVFVTGCSGFLGGWMVGELLNRGANVIGLIRDWVPRSRLFTEGIVEGVTVVRGGVEDSHLLERVLNEYEVDTVFHLAAQTIVPIANRNPISTFESNIRGTWNLLEACRRNPGVQRIVVASSDKAYGQQEELPYTEESPLQGRFPYDVSKSCADLISQAYRETYGLPVSITRCGNLYGGGDLNFNRIVPGTIRSLYEGQRPIVRSDGSYVRDYFYVKDAVLAYLDLAEWMGEKGGSEASFNFSNESRTTALEMVKKVSQAMHRTDLEPVVLNEAKGEIVHQELSAERARSVLGWKPRYTLDKGLEETVSWYKKHLDDHAVKGSTHD